MTKKIPALLLTLGFMATTTAFATETETPSSEPSEQPTTEPEKDWLDSTAETTGEFLNKAQDATIDALDAIKDKWNEYFGEEEEAPSDNPEPKGEDVPVEDKTLNI